ncbi:hypothetical protein DPMN_185216 [Dreissena polymorpha]|uniref:Uncharacterized protein n=1 Tax=Dreissena polymorpha TaxID=45954 RepID=A0A9D4I5C1_DREPO|nr:hypothetical protein DPMN_185216 [Dreissena polymorpha]
MDKRRHGHASDGHPGDKYNWTVWKCSVSPGILKAPDAAHYLIRISNISGNSSRYISACVIGILWASGKT